MPSSFITPKVLNIDDYNNVLERAKVYSLKV